MAPLASAHADGPKLALTIAVYGDSLGDGVWSGLYNSLRQHPETKLLRRAKIGAGLTRPDYAAWFSDLQAGLVQDQVDVAVVMFGANDQQNIRDDNHKGHLFRSDAWKAVYGGRVDAVLHALAERKITTIWLGLPVMRKDELNTGARYLDSIFEQAAKTSGASFVPLLADFADKEGGYQTHMADATGRTRQVRLDDGVHFSGYGYELIASKVLRSLAEIQGHADSGPTQ
jgi:hypothetical protein